MGLRDPLLDFGSMFLEVCMDVVSLNCIRRVVAALVLSGLFFQAAPIYSAPECTEIVKQLHPNPIINKLRKDIRQFSALGKSKAFLKFGMPIMERLNM